MKIAIVCHASQGGSGIVATELAMSLVKRGHEVHMVASERPFRLLSGTEVHFHKVGTIDYPLFKYPPHDLSLINKLSEIIAQYDIDVVHAHYAIPHAICAIVARDVAQVKKTKVVATMHGTDITLVGSHPDFRSICTYAMRQSDALTAVSKWLSQRTVEEFDIPEAPKVIYNFVDVERFNNTNRADHPGTGEFVIVHASNFRPVKRISSIIGVFNEIQKQLNARLLLVGNGPELGLARELCSELGICSRVVFLGATRKIEDIFKESHLFLLLSHYESFGLAALEAMACGVPAVVSKAGGLMEVVRDDQTGLICDASDMQTTAARATNLLKNAEQWKAMSSEAARSAIHDFPAEAIISEYEQVYEEVLG